MRGRERAQDGFHPPGHQAGQHSHRRQRTHQAHRLWALYGLPLDPQLQVLPEQR